MNAQQQRYIEISSKLADGTPLLRSEQLWLFDLLQPLADQFFTAPPGRRVDRWHFWMTMDSVLSGDAEKIIAARWQQPGRIATVLKRWRPICEQQLNQHPKRDLWQWAVQSELRRYVSKSARNDTTES